jgi:hypothetical protein
MKPQFDRNISCSVHKRNHVKSTDRTNNACLSINVSSALSERLSASVNNAYVHSHSNGFNGFCRQLIAI